MGGGQGLLGGSHWRSKQRTSVICGEPLPFWIPQLGIQDGHVAMFAWDMLAWDVFGPDIQHTLGSWFSFSVSVCPLALFIHLFLDLLRLPPWEGLLFLRICSEKRNSAGPHSQMPSLSGI